MVITEDRIGGKMARKNRRRNEKKVKNVKLLPYTPEEMKEIEKKKKELAKDEARNEKLAALQKAHAEQNTSPLATYSRHPIHTTRIPVTKTLDVKDFGASIVGNFRYALKIMAEYILNLPIECNFLPASPTHLVQAYLTLSEQKSIQLMNDFEIVSVASILNSSITVPPSADWTDAQKEAQLYEQHICAIYYRLWNARLHKEGFDAHAPNLFNMELNIHVRLLSKNKFLIARDLLGQPAQVSNIQNAKGRRPQSRSASRGPKATIEAKESSSTVPDFKCYYRSTKKPNELGYITISSENTRALDQITSATLAHWSQEVAECKPEIIKKLRLAASNHTPFLQFSLLFVNMVYSKKTRPFTCYMHLPADALDTISSSDQSNSKLFEFIKDRLVETGMKLLSKRQHLLTGYFDRVLKRAPEINENLCTVEPVTKELVDNLLKVYCGDAVPALAVRDLKIIFLQGKHPLPEFESISI